MTAYLALIRRELLEHRGAFLYAPAALLAALFLMVVFGLLFGDTHFVGGGAPGLAGIQVYELALTGVFALWGGYMMVALFFYYADSFSADRRNNALLFWKSMPQSDLKILGSKALAGITIFPLLVFTFAMITGLVVYLMSFLVAARIPFVPIISPVEMISAWVQMGVVGALSFVLTILWYAPFFGWVAGLSTLFQRWSIPLAFLIPGAVVLAEWISGFGGTGGSRPIGSFLSYRMEGLLEDKNVFEMIIGNPQFSPLSLVGELFADIDWIQMGLGLIFAAVVIYLASEYRRRRIEA